MNEASMTEEQRSYVSSCLKEDFLKELDLSRHGSGSIEDLECALRNWITKIKIKSKEYHVYQMTIRGGLKDTLLTDNEEFLKFISEIEDPEIKDQCISPLSLYNAYQEEYIVGRDEPVLMKTYPLFIGKEMWFGINRGLQVEYDKDKELIDPVEMFFYGKTSTCLKVARLLKERFLIPLDHLIMQKKEKSKGAMHTLMPDGHGGLAIQQIGVTGMDFNNKNYSEDVGVGFTKLVKSLSSKSPKGRLNILSGPPGTGKTYFIRGLINSCEDCIFVVLNPSYIGNIDSPALISCFMNFKNNSKKSKVVLVIEDADACLTPRDNNNMSVISSLLNITDGLIGEVLDFRILATTNRAKIDFDPAIKRKRRLDNLIEILPLERKHAEQVYAELTGGRTDLPNEKMEEKDTIKGFGVSKNKVESDMMTLAQIYHHASEYLVKETKKEPKDFTDLEKIDTNRARFQLSHERKEQFYTDMDDEDWDDDDLGDEFHDDYPIGLSKRSLQAIKSVMKF